MTADELKSRIHRDYSYPRTPDKPMKFEVVREACKQLALLMVDHCPISRELELALQRVEQAAMYAHASIARDYTNVPGVNPVKEA